LRVYSELVACSSGMAASSTEITEMLDAREAWLEVAGGEGLVRLEVPGGDAREAWLEVAGGEAAATSLGALEGVGWRVEGVG